MVGPVIDEIAGEYAGQVDVVKVDVEANGDTAMKYGHYLYSRHLPFQGWRGRQEDRRC